MLGLVSQQGGDGGSLVCSGSTLDTSCTAQERVCWSSCLIWKHLEGSLRTTAEEPLENSLSASWNRTSCYLNHQWARQLFVMTVGFRGPQAPWPASLWTGETSPMPPCRPVWGLNCALFWIFSTSYRSCSGLPRWCSGKEFSYECSRHKRHGLSP